MSVKIIDGDLFTTTAKYICHQVNCQGRMGSGVAKIVREKYPEAYQGYLYVVHEHPFKQPLGRAQFVTVHSGTTIVNMFAQDRYGYDGTRYTDYDAFQSCLSEIRDNVPPGETIAMPYKIGCGLGGGDWEVIYKLIEQELGATHHVELWRLQ